MNPSILLFTLFIFFFLPGCQNYNTENDRLDYSSDTTSITGLTGDTAKLVKTANLNFKVKDIEQSTRAVSELAQKFGGMIFYQNIDYVETARKELKLSTDSLMVVSVSTPRADITVRVPSENLEPFIYNATDLGYFTMNRKLQIDDRSLQYLENILKQKNRIETLAEPIQQKDKAFTNLRKIEVRDAVVNHQIANRAIELDSKYSTVSLSLFQNSLVRKELIANHSITDYQLPLKYRLINSLRDGWQYFLNFILVIAHLWVFILIAVVAFLYYRHFQQKKKETLLNVKTS